MSQAVCTLKHCRMLGWCLPGIKKHCAELGIDWRRFVNGIPVDELKECKSAESERLVALVEGLHNGK